MRLSVYLIPYTYPHQENSCLFVLLYLKVIHRRAVEELSILNEIATAMNSTMIVNQIID